MSYDPRCCIHTPECIHSLPEVFEGEGRPCNQPTGALANVLAAVIELGRAWKVKLYGVFHWIGE